MSNLLSTCRRAAFLLAIWIGSVSVIHGATEAAAKVSFRNDVMAVLSKAGCNAGPCHGNQNGKASFKLSLRGEDPEWDHRAMTRDMLGRRVNPMDPDQSLLLLKATTQLAHEGGRRFPKDSAEYFIFRNWIADGMPDDVETAPKLRALTVTPQESILIEPTNSVTLRVVAEFSDGRQQDVSALAVYEPASVQATASHDGTITLDGPGETTVLVRFLDQQAPARLAYVPARPGFVWRKVPANNYVDEHVFAKLRGLRMNPSEICTDHEFLRRAHLDLLGLLPTAEEARAFAADRRNDKRDRLVKRLLERPEFAEFWALKYSDILRNEEKVLDRKGVQVFSNWLRQGLATNRPLDVLARELVSARGSTYANPPANFHRANRDAVTRAEATAQLFLGTRLQCAKCHNHPFDRWTQADYYDWANIFSRVRYKVLENNKRDNLDSHEFVGEQIVYLARDGNIANPRTGKPATSRFLGSAGKLGETKEGSASETELDRLAQWIVGQPNFARSQVNWVWFQLMGRGIVDPIDDFRPTNPPSHPALLEELGKDLVRRGFDLRWLIRFVMNSRTYQLSSRPNDTNAGDELNYSHVRPRRLSAEQLFDTQHQVLGVAAEFKGFPPGLRAAQLPGGSPVRRNEVKMAGPEKFLAVFGKPARLLACECERSSETTLSQTFQLISSPEINALLVNPNNRLTGMLSAKSSDASLVEELYWTTLSRGPTPAENSAAVKHLLESPEKRAALEDLAWALVNSKEFILRP